MNENRQDADPRNIRILIADDRPQGRESLQALLETEDGLLVVGHARDGREAVNLCATLAPGVVLMDLEMPGLDGLAATRLMRSRANCPAIVILTIHADPWWQDQAAGPAPAPSSARPTTRHASFWPSARLPPRRFRRPGQKLATQGKNESIPRRKPCPLCL